MSRVWLITGANSGFGLAIAQVVRARGDVAVPTARAPEDADVLRLDVTDQESIDSAVEETVRRHGRIDVLVNNAGHGLVGAVEELSDDDLRKVLETNVFGVLRVTRTVLPHMRERRSGHIVQMSSVGGIRANPGHAAYATSKFALEGMSEALAAEVAPWNIGVTIVEPGPFRTDFAGRSLLQSQPIDAYADTPAGERRRGFADQDGRQPNDPVRGAEVIVDSIDDPDRVLRLPLGPEAVEVIRNKLASQSADLEAWASRVSDTQFG